MGTMARPTNIHHRRLRAIAAMEFRIVLYRWVMVLGPARYDGVLIASIILPGCIALLFIGNPSLASGTPAHWLAGPMWVCGGLLLIYCIFLGLVAAGLCGASAVRRPHHIVTMLPLTRVQRRLAAEAGRLLVLGPALAVALAMLLAAWCIATLSGAGSPSLVPVGYWLLAILGACVLGVICRHAEEKRWGRRRETTPLEWVALVATFFIANGLGRRLPESWHLAVHMVVFGLIIFGVFYSTRAIARRAELLLGLRRPEPRDRAAGALARAGSPLDIRWALTPELGLRRWARSAAALLALLALVAALFVVAWPLIVRAGDIAPHVWEHRAWPTTPEASDPGRLSLGARICLYVLPLVSVLLCIGLWIDASSDVSGWFAEEPIWRPPLVRLLPFREGECWRTKLLAAVVFAVACAVLGQAFAALGQVVARACGGATPMPAALHWVPLVAPVSALSVWALFPMMRYPARLVVVHYGAEWVVAVVGAVLIEFGFVVLGGPPVLRTLCRMTHLEDAYPYIWLPVWLAVTVAALLYSRWADRPCRWPVPREGVFATDTEFNSTHTTVLWTLVLTHAIWAAIAPLVFWASG